MTKKKYQKLATALMSRMMTDGKYPKGAAGHTLMHCKHIDIKNTKFKSYQDAWDSLKPVRKIYGL